MWKREGRKMFALTLMGSDWKNGQARRRCKIFLNLYAFIQKISYTCALLLRFCFPFSLIYLESSVCVATTWCNFFSPRGSFWICIKNNRIGAGFLRPLRVSGIIHERGNPLPPRDTKGLRGRSACNSPLTSPLSPMRADVTCFVWT